MGMNQGAAAENRVASRIEQDVEQVKSMTERVHRTRERVVRHARALGYFEPPADAKVSAPTPVITTMADALRELDQAIEHCSGALNVFD